MNLTGIFFGLFTTIVIGIGFFWVIRLEYYVGAQITKIVALIGMIIILISLFLSNFTLSAMVGIFGGTIIWGAIELPEQAQRVANGLFPSNPKKPNINP